MNDRRRGWLVGALVACLLQLSITAQPGQVVRTIEGEALHGAVSGAGPEEVVVVTTTGERRVPLDLVQRIDLRPGDASATVKPPGLWLRSGMILATQFAGSTDGAGLFKLQDVADSVPISWRFVRAVCFTPRGDVDQSFREAVAAEPGASDLLFARNEEGRVVRVSVEFSRLENRELWVKFSGTERAMPLERVYGIVFGKDSGVPPDVQAKPRVRVRAGGGDEIAGKLVELDQKFCRIQLDEGVVLALARSEIDGIDVESDRLVHLTDLEPQIEQVAALDRTWPPLRDRGPGGGGIALRGRVYDRGLVIFPRTRMSYAIDGRFDVFEATIGFEDRAGTAANAVFRVLADDVVLFDSGPVSREAFEHISLPIANARRLVLEVDFGACLDLGDMCVFAAPRLLSK